MEGGKKLIWTCLCIIWWAVLPAQNVQLNEAPGIFNLMSEIDRKFDYEKKIKGYRIQILNTPDRRELERVRSSFQQRFGDLNATWNYQAPFYRLKVGAFQTKLDAYPLYKRIKRQYPSSFLILDDLTIEEIFRFEGIL
jgi:hypothetical protein